MPQMEWNESYSVGITHFDEQHRGIINMLNRLGDAVNTNTEADALSEIISGMMAYAEVHFRDEEKYLETINYPKLKEHKIIHKNFVEGLGDLGQVLIDQGPSPELAIVLQEKVALWLINHITVTDMDYRHFYENQ